MQNTGMSPQSWSLLGFSRDRSLMSLLGGCWKEKKASLDSDGLVQSSVTEPNTGVNPQTGEIASWGFAVVCKLTTTTE